MVRARRIIDFALLGGSVALLAFCREARADCADLLAQAPPHSKARAITARDLVELRDIGRPDGALVGNARPLSPSPDGRRIAFMMMRADPATNGYCIGLATMDAKPGSSPRLIHQGGDIILGAGDYRGVILSTGYPVLLAPAWSPDGKWIAFLRRDHGSTQLWLVAPDGQAAHPLTRSPVDIEQFAWNADGTALIYSSRQGQVAERESAAQEALAGFRYDDRYVPMMSDKPMPIAAIPLSVTRLTLADGQVQPGNAADRALLPPDPIHYDVEPIIAKADDGRRAIAQNSTPNPVSPMEISVTTAVGGTIACSSPTCQGRFTGLWWMPHGGPLLFLRREGWNFGTMVLYRWQPGAGAPQRVFGTNDVISGCVAAVARLTCLRESATVPARIVRIDPGSGRSDLLYDPNPGFASIRFGKVERLEWRNDRGLEVKGDLVLPPGYGGGKRLPLIITTYRSNGFLRGATGNEYPIHLFAEHGFAVLALDRPLPVFAAKRTEGDPVKLREANDRDWAERWSMQSSVMVGVQHVIDMGVADPDRIGITGLSDGSSTVGFALINSKRFAAAAMSTCCLEPWSVNSTIGPAFAAMMRKQGYPPATSDDRAFWKVGSMIRNAAAIDTPLLMQLADREYLTAIDVFTALREQGQPVDMYVFPDEYHNKWQPLHRLAVYERNLDWFRFWLQDKEDPDPRKADQYSIWRKLRDQRKSDANH